MVIPAIRIRTVELGLHRGPFPTRPLGLSAPATTPPAGTTKPLCLCNLLREKDEERRRRRSAERPDSG